LFVGEPDSIATSPRILQLQLQVVVVLLLLLLQWSSVSSV